MIYLRSQLKVAAGRSFCTLVPITKSNRISDASLTALSINHMVYRCAVLANLANAHDMTPHSLRRGLATSAAHASTPLQSIMRAGRWKQTNTVMEYIEASDRFTNNAASNVLKNRRDDHE